ncbi:SRPBCC family protein [Azohydromonas aeria]|uniref:SRPBCC family protein n=1 Tax=Azohydromonas aeria TaxID=2590212 RepID=UPI0012FC7664|nr:cyclase [Azohydromonas aeria]
MSASQAPQSSSLQGSAHEVRCALPIGLPPEELHRLWLDARAQRVVMAQLAEVSASGDLWHWKAHAKWIGDVEWDSRIVVDDPGRRIAWQSTEGAELPNEGELVFGPGRPGWGTEVRLTWRFDPPGGKLGDFVARLTHAPHAMGALVLRRFKSLAETGEVPTLEHNPTTRDDPDPYGAFE